MPDYYLVKYQIACVYSVYYLICFGEIVFYYIMKKNLCR